MQHQYKTASLGNLSTTSTLACGSPRNEKNLSSNENSLVVDSLPKNLLQRYKEEGDVLSSQQPSFLASSVARGHDKCVGNTNSSSESSNINREIVNDDNNSNVKAFQANLTSLSSSNVKAESSGLPVEFSSYNLRHNLSSAEQGIRKYEKGNKDLYTSG